MKFVDLNEEYKYFLRLDKRISEVCSSGHFLFGEQLKNLEKEFADFVGVKNAIGVKNCTDAIILVLKSFLKKNQTVIIPNFGAYPTAVAVKNVTDNIYYVDVDRTMTMDVSKLPEHIKDGVVICVHLFGNNCDMKKIKEYCDINNHVLIEDCAQSTGSGSGNIGDYSVFSFYPTKPLSSMGDGGMICTNRDREIFDKLRFYGQKEQYIENVGINSRMDEIQSGIVRYKLPHFQDLNERRKKICKRYKKHVRSFDERKGCVFHQFVVLFEEREMILKELYRRNIPHIIHYKSHVSDFKVLSGKNNIVNYRINDKCVSLPCHPFMKEEELEKVEEFLYDFRNYEYDK